MIYDRARTRQIPELGGLSKIMPFATVGFIIGGLVSMGMPLFSGFVAEFPIFTGVWETQWLVAVIPASPLWLRQRISCATSASFFRKNAEKFEGHMTDITVLDKVAITTFCLFMILIGLYPSFMVPMVEKGVENILRLLGGALMFTSTLFAWVTLKFLFSSYADAGRGTVLEGRRTPQRRLAHRGWFTNFDGHLPDLWSTR